MATWVMLVPKTVGEFRGRECDFHTWAGPSIKVVVKAVQLGDVVKRNGIFHGNQQTEPACLVFKYIALPQRTSRAFDRSEVAAYRALRSYGCARCARSSCTNVRFVSATYVDFDAHRCQHVRHWFTLI